MHVVPTDFEVVAWNEAAEQIFGYTSEEAMGQHAAGLTFARGEGLLDDGTLYVANRGALQNVSVFSSKGQRSRIRQSGQRGLRAVQM